MAQSEGNTTETAIVVAKNEAMMAEEAVQILASRSTTTEYEVIFFLALVGYISSFVLGRDRVA